MLQAFQYQGKKRIHVNIRIISRHTHHIIRYKTLRQEPNSSDEKYHAEYKISLKIQLKSKNHHKNIQSMKHFDNNFIELKVKKIH